MTMTMPMTMPPSIYEPGDRYESSFLGEMSCPVLSCPV